MKYLFLITTLSALIFTQCPAQNNIIAGQSVGDNIHYTDYNPDSAAYLMHNEQGFTLDIDKNGVDDLLFWVNASGDPYTYTNIWSIVEVINKDVKIISYSDDGLNWVKKLTLGDTIGISQNWSTDNDSIFEFQQYFYDSQTNIGTTTGEFDNGYLGFKIDYPVDTFYGWINISASPGSIIAKESAVCGLTVNMHAKVSSRDYFEVYPNPCTCYLNFAQNSNKSSNINCEIYNSQGMKINAQKVISGKIDISSLITGLYLIKFYEGDRILTVRKVVKK